MKKTHEEIIVEHFDTLKINVINGENILVNPTLKDIKALMDKYAAQYPSQPERVEGGIVAKLQNEIEQLKLIRSGIHEGSPKWHDYSGRIEQQERIILQLRTAPSAVDWEIIREAIDAQVDRRSWILEDDTEHISVVALNEILDTYLQANYTLTAKD